MGWTTFALSQVLLTSVSLGMMKRHAIITFKPEAIKNETARLVISKAISMGEDISEVAERLTKQAYDAVQDKSKK